MSESKQAASIINTEVLKKQVGNYGIAREDVRLGALDAINLPELCINKLYSSISEYRNSKDEQIEKFKKSHPNLKGLLNTNIVGQNEHIFRTALIQFIENKEKLPKYEVQTPDIRATQPEQATITLEKLLGKDGVALYQAALEEEANSEAFRKAVFCNSTEYKGKYSIGKKPVLIVGGQSGSGKSFAANAVVNKYLDEHNANDKDKKDIYFVTADGRIVREVSQMRKLMIRIANAQGYTGVKDLHSQSKVLELTKTCVREAALESKTLGVVIPETFSDWKPGDIPNKKKKMMEDLINREDTELIFTRVTARKIRHFKRIVQFMGSRRAWKTDFSDSDSAQIDDLNSTENLAESKAYGAKGFIPGLVGSKLAERWFLKNKANPSSYLITNDLMLVKKDQDSWVETNSEDKDAKLVSKRAWDAYQDNPAIDLFTHAEKIQPQITTPEEKKLLDCIVDITEYLGDAEDEKELIIDDSNAVALTQMRNILERILVPDDQLASNSKQKKKEVHDLIQNFKNQRRFSSIRNFFNWILPSRIKKLFTFFTPPRTITLLRKSEVAVKEAISEASPDNTISEDLIEKNTKQNSYSKAMAKIIITAGADAKAKAEHSWQTDETVDKQTVAEEAPPNDDPEEAQSPTPDTASNSDEEHTTTRPGGP